VEHHEQMKESMLKAKEVVYPSSNQGILTAEPRRSHAVFTLRENPPTSPWSTQGHCWKWSHEAENLM